MFYTVHTHRKRELENSYSLCFCLTSENFKLYSVCLSFSLCFSKNLFIHFVLRCLSAFEVMRKIRVFGFLTVSFGIGFYYKETVL